MPGPTQGSRILCSSSILPNLEMIYSTVLGGVITTPRSLLLNVITTQHSQLVINNQFHLAKLYKNYTTFPKLKYSLCLSHRVLSEYSYKSSNLHYQVL